MNKMIIAAVALGMFGTANAASLTNKEYKTGAQAAKAAAAYTLDKSAGAGLYKASDLRIAKDLSKNKYDVESKDGSKSLTITVKKDAPGQYRGYIPNRYVFTPPGAGSK